MSYYGLIREDGVPIKIECYGSKNTHGIKNYHDKLGKIVLCHELFYNDDYRNLTEIQYEDIQGIVYCMQNDLPIPRQYIRKGYGQIGNPNAILTNTGVNHLHLTDAAKNDTLLYYLEYNNFYVLLCVGSHDEYMTGDPNGKRLLSAYYKSVEISINKYDYSRHGNLSDIRHQRRRNQIAQLYKHIMETTRLENPIAPNDMNAIMDYNPQRGRGC